AIVTQNNTAGNQPPTIEMLPKFTVRARTVAPMATTAAVTTAATARSQCGGRERGRGWRPDRPAAWGLVLGWIVSGWMACGWMVSGWVASGPLVVSVWVLMADVFLVCATGVDRSTVGRAAIAVPRQTP